MQVKASIICQLLRGEIIGDPDVLISKPAKIEEGEPGAISFLGNMKYESYIYSCESSVILVGMAFMPKKEISATLIKVEDVYTSLSLLMQHFSEAKQQLQPKTISPQAFIHEEAEIGEGARRRRRSRSYNNR